MGMEAVCWGVGGWGGGGGGSRFSVWETACGYPIV